MNLKHTFVILFSFSLLIFSSCLKKDDVVSPDTSTVENLTFQHNGLIREYILYKPGNLPENPSLVFVLHGYSGDANSVMHFYGMNDVADVNKFVVCYPLGTEDYVGYHHWNARLTISSTDDIGFLTEIAEHLQTEYNLDTSRTFVCGHSNGGFMSYTLACEAQEVFKAIASVAGTMSGYTWENRDEASAVPVLQIHGVEDNYVPIDGSMPAGGGWGGAPAMDTIIDFWNNLNNCTTTNTVNITANTSAYYHTGGVNGNEVWFYKINNFGHEWPGDTSIPGGDVSGIKASEVIWEFFSQY
jgi:polyhydroxybutyrate depolymerase